MFTLFYRSADVYSQWSVDRSVLGLFTHICFWESEKTHTHRKHKVF